MVTGQPPGDHDAALLERIVQRDQSALAALYDRYSRLVFSLLVRIVGDRADAEDLLQEVFVRVWDRADAYDKALGTPAAWLVRIARNRAIDRVRARAVRPAEAGSVLPVEHPSGGPSPEQAAGEAETRRAVAGALATLPPEQRELIERAFFDGLTHTELAERSGLPLGTVKTRIRTGMQALKRLLGPADEGR